jgi:hypothetical protein
MTLLGNISELNTKDNPMIKVNITASEPNNAPAQPTDGQQPGQQNQQQSDQNNKDKPPQQK